MPLGGRSSNRLDMLLNISVSGLKQVDEFEKKVKGTAGNLDEMSKALASNDKVAKNAEKKLNEFTKAVDKGRAVEDRYEKSLEKVNKALEKQYKVEDELNTAQDAKIKHTKELKSSLDQIEKESTQMNKAFKEIQGMKPFNALEEGAKGAKAQVKAINARIKELVPQIQKMRSDNQQTRDPNTGRFRKKPAHTRDPQFKVDLQAKEREVEALKRARDVTEDLTKSTQRYSAAQSQVAHSSKEVERLEGRLQSVGNTTNKAVARMEKLRATLEEKAKIINELAGEELVKLDDRLDHTNMSTDELNQAYQESILLLEKLEQQTKEVKNSTGTASQSQQDYERSLKSTTEEKKKANREWDTMRQRISANTDGLFGFRRSLGALRNQILVVLFATQGLRTAFNSSRDAAVIYEKTLRGLRSMLTGMGEDLEKGTAAAEKFASRGIINLDGTSKALQNLLATGIGLEKAEKMLYALTDAAAFNAKGQQDLETSVIRATEAIRNQRSEGLQAVGFTKKLTEAYRDHALSIGKSRMELSEQTRAMIAFNLVMQQSARFSGDSNEWLLTLEGTMNDYRGKVTDTHQAIGELLTPTILAFNDMMITANLSTQDFLKSLDGDQAEKFNIWGQRLVDSMSTGFSIVGSFTKAIVKFVNVIGGDNLLTLAQWGLAIKFINRLQLRSAKHLQTNRELVAQYTITQRTNIATQRVVNQETGVHAKGLQALSILYRKNQIEIHKEIQSLKVRAAALRTNTGRMMAFGKVIGLSLTKNLVAARSAMIAFGGATKIALTAVKSMVLFLGKIAWAMALVWALGKIVEEITNIGEASNAAQEAQERLNKTLDITRSKADKAILEGRRASNIAQAYGINDESIQQIQNYKDRVAELIDQQDRLRNIINNGPTYNAQTGQGFTPDDIENFKTAVEGINEQVEKFNNYISQSSFGLRTWVEEINEVSNDIRQIYQETSKLESDRLGQGQAFDAVKAAAEFETQFKNYEDNISRVSEISLREAGILEQQLLQSRQEFYNQTAQMFEQGIAQMSESIDERSLSNMQRMFELLPEGYEKINRNAQHAVVQQRMAVQEIIKENERLVQSELDAFKKRVEISERGLHNLSFSLRNALLEVTGGNQGSMVQDFQGRLEGLFQTFNQSDKSVEDIENLKGGLKDLKESFQQISENTSLSPLVEDPAAATPYQNVIDLLEEMESASTGLASSTQYLAEEEEKRMMIFRAFEEALNIKLDQTERAIELERQRLTSVHALNVAMENQQELQEKINRSNKQSQKLQDFSFQTTETQLSTRHLENLQRVQIATSELNMARQNITEEDQKRLNQQEAAIQVMQDELSLKNQLIDLAKSDLERKIDEGKLLEREAKELRKLIDTRQDEADNLNAQIDYLNRLNDAINENADAQNVLTISVAAFSDAVSFSSRAIENYNTDLSNLQELQSIYNDTMDTTLKIKEKESKLVLVPMLGESLVARQANNRALQEEIKLQKETIRGAKDKRTAVLMELEDYRNILNDDKIVGAQRAEALQRVEQLEIISSHLQKVIKDTKLAQKATRELMEITANQEFTQGLVDAFEPQIERALSFADSMASIRDKMILDLEQFNMEQAKLLKDGEIDQRQHRLMAIEGANFYQEQMEKERKMMLAGLVRDIGKEIAAYAARQAAASGNIVSALSLLAGGGAAIGISNRIARGIERSAQSRFQRAQFEFQNNQQRILGDSIEEGQGDSSERSSRKFGGTIRAENLVVNISPTILVEGEQVFIGSGSVTEFSSEVNQLVLETTQQAIDNREIDLSNVPRG